MARPVKNKNGTWSLTFQFQGKRAKFTLGKISKPQAFYFASKVDLLADFKKNGGALLPGELQSWVDGVHDRHRQQLSDIGVFSDYYSNITVIELTRLFLEDYESRPGIEESTKRKTRSTLENRIGKLEKYRLSDIEPKQKSSRRNALPILSPESRKILVDFNSWQRNFYAKATWSRDNKLLRSIGKYAVENGFCDFNPFTTLPTESMVNDERNATIPVESVLDAMDACLDPDTELALALARFSAFRTPSEVRTLKWKHVDFNNGRIEILDSKKKRPRFMPLFDRVRTALESQLAHTERERFVVSKSFRSKSDSDNYQRISEAIRRSGQELWPRLRQNLRSSCENDLLEIFPERLVAAWVGHTIRVSRDHYQKQRNSSFAAAIENARENGLMAE